MNTGSKCYVKSLGIVSLLITVLACFSISGCGSSEQQLKEGAEGKAKDEESTQASTGTGPTSLGSISIGMKKAEYISVLGIKPINCNTYKNSEGEHQRSELKFLHPKIKALCWDFSPDFDKNGSIENIQVGGLSYEVIEANTSSSKLVETVGYSSKAIFFKDRLISLEISSPNIALETMKAKYGEPKLVDNRSIEVCKNKIGNEFKNEVGNLDAVWINGEVNAILRAETSPPQKTCTDGSTWQYYILEESSQLKMIEDAINNYRAEFTKKEAEHSLF